MWGGVVHHLAAPPPFSTYPLYFQIMTARIDFQDAFTARYPQRAYIIPAMQRALGLTHIRWRDLTRLNLARFVDYLSQSHAPNSVKVLTSTLKAFLNLYSEEIDLPCKSFAKVLSVKAVPSQHIALTEQELMRLERYQPKTSTERDVKILAMREALCGARGSDSALLTTNNISNGFITYVSKKTKTETTVPLHHLITKYLSTQPAKTHKRAVINTTLRRMCKHVCIAQLCTVYVNGQTVTKPKYELVSMHTMRRTFCTMLAMRGVPVELIRLYAGHRSQTITQRYIVGDATTPNSAALAFFQNAAPQQIEQQ